MEKAAAVTLILTVLLILLRGKCAGVEVYGAFLSGAKKGMEAAWQLLPALTGMLLMLSLMNASGLTALLVRLLSPLTAILNLPQEVAPMLILRPMTGSGSLAALQEIFAQYGADSRVGRIASVLMGSSETIFYTMSVYRGGREKAAGRAGRVAAVLPDVRVGLRANLLKNQENRLQERGKSCIINRYAG